MFGVNVAQKKSSEFVREDIEETYPSIKGPIRGNTGQYTRFKRKKRVEKTGKNFRIFNEETEVCENVPTLENLKFSYVNKRMICNNANREQLKALSISHLEM